MKRTRIWLSMLGAVVLALLCGFFLFDSYVQRAATDQINTVMKSEAASIQQGNLLNAITKLESAVATSESLRGVAVFDSSIDPNLRFSLIQLGKVPLESINSRVTETRTGIFDRIYTRLINDNKVVVFYFQPDFVFWSYLAFGCLLLFFSSVIVSLSFRMESIKSQERSEVLTSIWQQISHDIRSPLGALKIFAAVVERTGTSTELIGGAIQRIDEILEDLKLRSESAGHDDLFRVDLAVQQVVAEKTLEFPSYQITVESQLPCEAMGSQAQFKRMISNLLNNAVEASSPDKPISVRIEREGQRIRIKVIDRGVGISKEVQELLFRRGSTWGKKSGSGLGLHHARKVTEALKGQISLKSVLNSGTEITVDLAAQR